MSKISEIRKQLEAAADYKLNALLRGNHGTGKTTIVHEIFAKKFGKRNVDWISLSGATLDPFIDFIGCPKQEFDEKVGEEVLKLIRPAMFSGQGPKAIFMDEMNRTHKKVRNALLELIQFKSINGREFSNLQVVWAAVNPEGESYDVEALDPAQADRFQIQIDFPEKPDREYFTKKYGNAGKAACVWFDNLWKEKKLRHLMSPRRLEYALQCWQLGITTNVIPNSCNPGGFLRDIANNDVLEELEKLKTKAQKIKFFADENNFLSTKEACIKNDSVVAQYVPYWPKEKISTAVAESDDLIASLVTVAYIDDTAESKANSKLIKGILQDIMDAGTNKKACEFIRDSEIFDE